MVRACVCVYACARARARALRTAMEAPCSCLAPCSYGSRRHMASDRPDAPNSKQAQPSLSWREWGHVHCPIENFVSKQNFDDEPS